MPERDWQKDYLFLKELAVENYTGPLKETFRYIHKIAIYWLQQVGELERKNNKLEEALRAIRAKIEEQTSYYVNTPEKFCFCEISIKCVEIISRALYEQREGRDSAENSWNRR